MWTTGRLAHPGRELRHDHQWLRGCAFHRHTFRRRLCWCDAVSASDFRFSWGGCPGWRRLYIPLFLYTYGNYIKINSLQNILELRIRRTFLQENGIQKLQNVILSHMPSQYPRGPGLTVVHQRPICIVCTTQLESCVTTGLYFHRKCGCPWADSWVTACECVHKWAYFTKTALDSVPGGTIPMCFLPLFRRAMFLCSNWSICSAWLQWRSITLFLNNFMVVTFDFQ